MSKAGVSIIIPCYMQAHYLGEALNSVIAQTYSDWECIIINDGSTDNTEQIAQQYLQKDKRFKYLFKQNGGLSSARNAGLKIASGQFIQFLDADDFLHPEKLQTSVNYISQYPTCELVICNYKVYNSDSKQYYVSEYDIDRELSLKSILMEWDINFTIPIHCGLIKRTVLPFFDDRLKAKEDWLMWVEVFSKIKSFHFINNYYAFYRVHNLGLTRTTLIIETNTLLVYPLIYEKIESVELKNLFFERLTNHLKQVLESKDQQIHLFSKSNTYKLGYYLLLPIKSLKQFMRKL